MAVPLVIVPMVQAFPEFWIEPSELTWRQAVAPDASEEIWTVPLMRSLPTSVEVPPPVAPKSSAPWMSAW